ncbi:hypothetical protein BDP27DRAFT_1428886 [Rhodocollybia butyracea]|uniref:Uncharacterized protein n=1 Tax=Rhodocollybia butyracea TaxID=206335 RepID=A0A9P5PAP7_9AGAR|nr:hypothetical protein BDP27DRAFT_1428886 [Rhodocollybia butyracea]
MALMTRQITGEIGETGAGINSADEIEMTQKNLLTSVWAKYCEKAPWYFEMRDLIAGHPNAKPVSLGNGQSAIDLSVLDSLGSEDGEAVREDGSGWGADIESMSAIDNGIDDKISEIRSTTPATSDQDDRDLPAQSKSTKTTAPKSSTNKRFLPDSN